MEDNTYEPLPDNLNLPATKADLQSLEKDLRATLATKAELAVFRLDINEKIDSLPTKEDFSRLQTVVDKLVGEVKIYNDERAVEAHRLKRLEDWTKEASKKVNVPFEL